MSVNTSLRRHEGYLLVDHRESPGLTSGELNGLPVGAGRGVFEGPTYTCSHCCRIVVINNLRTRVREWCAQCDRVICDACAQEKAATGQCNNFEKFAQDYLEAQSKISPPFPTSVGV